MKYTIEGFSQKFLTDNGLDCTDAILLRYIVDFYHTEKMSKITFDGVEYFWLKYEYVIEQLPILGIKSKDGLYRRMKKYVDCGLFRHFTKRSGGTYSCYHIDSQVYAQAVGNKSDGTDEKSEGYGSKVGGGTDEKSEQKTILSKKTNLSKDSEDATPVADEPSNQKQKPSAEEVSCSAPQFDEFWALYPNKKGKGAARKAFVKAVKKVDYQIMVGALMKQKLSHDWKKDNGQYIPHPATWLNQERWDDVVADPGSQPRRPTMMCING
jgi:hypothetical protein